MEKPVAQGSTSLGERLKALRSARSAALGRKLSQQEVANAIGVARSYVAACETDSDKPGYDTFVALADYYGVSLDWLARGDPPSSHSAKICEVTARLFGMSEEYVDAVLRVISGEMPRQPRNRENRQSRRQPLDQTSVSYWANVAKVKSADAGG